MKQIIERLGWVYYGSCECQGGGWRYKKEGKDYTVTIYYRKNRFAIIKNDQVKKSGHSYEMEKIITEYELAN